MKRINNVNLEGKIVSEVDLRFSKERQIPVLNFKILHKHPKQNNPLFIDVEVWGEYGMQLNELIQRGDIVFVCGQLKLDIWGDQDHRKSKIKIRGDSVWIGGIGGKEKETEEIEQTEKEIDFEK